MNMRSSIQNIAEISALEATAFESIGGHCSTFQLLERGACIAPDAPALSFFLKTQDFRRPFQWTYREWMGRIRQTANMLRSLGIGRDDVVAFVLPNLPETHWTIWGGEAAGVVFAVNPLLEAPMLRELLHTAKAKWVVTLAPTPGTDLWEKVASVVPELAGLRGVLTVSPLTYLRSPLRPALKWRSRLQTPRSMGHVRVLDFHDQLKRHPRDALQFSGPTPDCVASYFCTGGTTGLPKIAVRTHRTEVANALQIGSLFGSADTGPGKAYFCGLPLFHVNAQIGTGLNIWAKGAHVVLGTPQGYRAPGLVPSFWKIAEAYKLTSFSGVPTVYSALLQIPRGGHDLSSLQFGVCGAAPMPVELFHRFQKEMGIKILEGYGLTEAGCVSSINPPGGQSRVGSIGLRLPWQDMRAAKLNANGDFDRWAEFDEVGTIVVKGPNLFRGYLNPVHNKGLWMDIPVGHGQSERWLNTGDLGRVDQDGYFWLTGRNKELIIRGGHNIDPKMIEEPMHTHPGVGLAAAVGRPDAHAGEVPVLYVQLRPGAHVTEEALRNFAQEHIAERAAWPKHVHIVEALPTTAVGKIFKPALVQRELESICVEEANACGVELLSCEAQQDPRQGLVLRWKGRGNTQPLADRLGQFAFKHEQMV